MPPSLKKNLPVLGVLLFLAISTLTIGAIKYTTEHRSKAQGNPTGAGPRALLMDSYDEYYRLRDQGAQPLFIHAGLEADIRKNTAQAKKQAVPALGGPELFPPPTLPPVSFAPITATPSASSAATPAALLATPYAFASTLPASTSSPSASASTVLGTTTTGYIQYLPVPGVSNFSSNSFNASADVSVPFKLPPGPGGYTPSLGISYSSAAVDALTMDIDTRYIHMPSRQSGPLGLGWSISGMDSTISVDYHGSDDPCNHTFKITFPGGQGELFKTDVNGNKITKCSWNTTKAAWQVNSAWTAATEWRTNPEMFLKIKLGPSDVIAAGDADFNFGTIDAKHKVDIWKIATPDGATYYFGNGYIDNNTFTPFYYYDYYLKPYSSAGQTICSYNAGLTVTAWRLFKSVNNFSQKIKYTYTADNLKTIDPSCARYTSTIKPLKIEYGPNRVEFAYNQARSDTKLTIPSSDSVGTYYKDTDQYKSDTKALSVVLIYANNTLSRRYDFSYYPTWTSVNASRTSTPVCGTTSTGQKIQIEPYQLWGYYTINDSLQTFHLTLQQVKESLVSGTTTTAFPVQTFTYQAIPYDANVYSGETGQFCGTYAMATWNSIYLKKADNGYGATSEYTFDAKRLSGVLTTPTNVTYTDNSCHTSNTYACSIGLKQARLAKVRVSDGIGNFSETLLDHEGNQPQTVTHAVIEDTHNDLRWQFDSDLVGYAAVTSYAGKKNVAVTTAAKTWAGKTRSQYHQSLAGTGCAKKDPRAGMAFRSQSFDDKGVLAENITYTRFFNKNTSTADPNGEACSAIPTRPLLLTLITKSITAKEGQAVANLSTSCESASPAAYCNHSTVQYHTYDWDLALPNNPEAGHFAGLTKSETFVIRNSPAATKKLASSETAYVSQGYYNSSTSTYYLNKPVQSWMNNPDVGTDTKKYKWQRMYYDGNALGVLSPTGKNLLTKTEQLLANGTVAGKSEVTTYDTYGNATQVKDGNGNVSKSSYDGTYNAYVTDTTNALSQKASMTYDYMLGVPLTVTDVNGKVTKNKYDNLGRLTAILKPGDAAGTPSVQFTYYLNKNSTYGVPLAVKSDVLTTQNTAASALSTFDLYDGLGQKIQSQSLINGQVITSWADQDPAATGLVGNQSLASENFVSPGAFGKLVTTLPANTKSATVYTSLSGLYTRSIDINNVVNFQAVNPEAGTTKTLAANGLMATAVTDPVTWTKTSTVCKGLQVQTEAVFLTNRFAYSCPAGGSITGKNVTNFLGNSLSEIDTAGKTLTTNTYDELGRLTSTTNADTDPTKVNTTIDSYDMSGNVTKSHDALGTAFTMTYDGLNRPVQKSVNTVAKIQYAYDQKYDSVDCGTTPVGKLCRKLEWDNFGNPLKYYFAYDDFGRVKTERVNYGGKLAAKFGTSDFITSYTYDNIDRPVTIAYPVIAGAVGIEETVSYTYAGPYLTKVSGQKNYVTGTTYDYLGRMTQQTFGNNTVEGYAYDANRRLQKLTAGGGAGVLSSSASILNLSYAYDNPTGNILGITDGLTYTIPLQSQTATYTYDSLSRLTQAKVGGATDTYSYDDMNNLTAKAENGQSFTYSTNANFPYHGVKSVNGGAAFTYDALGRVKSYTAGHTVQVPAYDPTTGKPQQITQTGSPGETYYYDADGRRIMKAVVDASGHTSQEILYVNQYLEKDNVSRVVRKNYYADGLLVAVRAIDF